MIPKCQRRRVSRALACVGAVIGAGFASGREVTQFFSQYGPWSWALITLSALVMTALCALLLRGEQGAWYAHFQGRTRRICLMLLLCVTGGAMISAGGELAALTLPVRSAYGIGVLLTIGAAALLSAKSLRPLTGVSALLTVMLVVAYLLISARGEAPSQAPARVFGAGELLKAALFAAGYAGLNMAISVGVVCECGDLSRRGRCRMPLMFGLMMLMMMFLSNALYLQHPRVMDEVLPMIALLRGLGMTGYYLGAILLYLAVMSTLIAILRALRGQLSEWLGSGAAWLICLLAPLCLSMIGFTGIISSLYPWLGLICLAAMVAPGLKRRA